MKNESILRLVFTLTIIGMVSALFLAFVYQWTLPHIQEHEARAREKALKDVLPGAARFEEIEQNNKLFFEGYDENDVKVGVAVIASGAGFQGMIDIMVGTDFDQEIILGINILDHEETPGLGARITEEEFKDNFKEMPFGEYQVIQASPDTSYEVEAISGATVSTESIVGIVEKAVNDIKNVYGGGN